jgi:ParB/RepB/Spo0J family partition protein
MNNESDNDQPIPEASASKENTIPDRAASPEHVASEEDSNPQLTTDEDEGAESPVVKRTRELLESEPGSHPPPDPRAIDPQSALGKMFAAMNPGSIIPSTPDEIAQAAFFARLREQDDMPEPSETYLNRPRTPAELRKSLRERLHPHVEGPIETLHLPLAKISNGNFENCRRSKDTEERASLKASMASKTGLINAIVVCRDAHDPDKYHLIAGFTRYELARELGWPTIRCTIREVHSERDALLMNLSENVARSNLTSFELAAQIELICRRFLLKPEDIAEALGLSVRHVYSMLRYMSVLPPDVISDWKNAHPLLTFRILDRLSKEPNPTRAWQAMRARHEIEENKVPTTFVPTEDDGDTSGWEEFKRPTKAKLARLRDILSRAKLPNDPELLRKIAIGIVDWARGATRSIPHILAPQLKRRTRPRRLAKKK